MTTFYDAVAYPSFAFPLTHPGNFAAMAILHGHNPAPVANCRVLEIGCGEGANLIPMAYAIPDARFTGFDLARLPIERGQQRIVELGLTNIRLFEADILNIGPELGQFDYIVAHGIYAWVPEPVRNRLIALCAELLAPNGVAFFSYNALPGCHIRRIVRDAMLFRSEGIADPNERAATGVEFLQFLHKARGVDDAYSRLLLGQYEYLSERDPHATIHDEIGESYHPVTFLDFVGHARAHGLDYLSEAALPPPGDPGYRSEVQAVLEEIAGPDPLRQEQALDYVRARIFRETLITHAETDSGSGRILDPNPAHLPHLLFASAAISSPGEAAGATRFTLSSGARTDINHLAAVAVLCALEAAWPLALNLDELCRQTAGSGFTPDETGLRLILRLVISQLVELRAWNVPAVRVISTHPRVSACARQEGRIHARTSTLLHTTVALENPRFRALLGLLDGTRDRKTLADALQAAFPGEPRDGLEQGIESGLQFLLRAGLLEA
ncbi:methyltransferase domain-containing protein [Terracidiphilus sp.]|jgi:SAM-dependent methyltransferase|uniref:methyltransferase domain-containing protein n=1 Tax=Terracidiphilus sp. TaxID=1964191 RepID=UPI003C1B5B6F